MMAIEATPAFPGWCTVINGGLQIEHLSLQSHTLFEPANHGMRLQLA